MKAVPVSCFFLYAIIGFLATLIGFAGTYLLALQQGSLEVPVSVLGFIHKITWLVGTIIKMEGVFSSYYMESQWSPKLIKGLYLFYKKIL